jgi:hypothetical protein
MDAEISESFKKEPSISILYNIRGFGRDLLKALEKEECLSSRLF